jgi:CRISPR system Cascade subunit CasE
MAYLSRIWINPLRQQGRRLISDPQAMLAAVLGGLPAQPVSERVLWRLDSDEPRRPALMVLTQSRPSWEHLVEQAGWPSSDTPETPQAETRAYLPLLARLENGQSYAFRLTANPVQNQRVTSPQGDHNRSVRLGHRTAEHQLAWLLARTSKWGFEIPAARSSEAVGDPDVREVRIVSRDRRSFYRGGGGGTARRNGARPVTLHVVTYEGLLTVTDVDELRSRLLGGCGPAKAYGCSLLTLSPLTPAVGRVR